jgi:hypothetical protein
VDSDAGSEQLEVVVKVVARDIGFGIYSTSSSIVYITYVTRCVSVYLSLRVAHTHISAYATVCRDQQGHGIFFIVAAVAIVLMILIFVPQVRHRYLHRSFRSKAQ